MKDARQVYYHDIVIEGADPASFHAIHVEGDQWGMHYAKDRHRYYFKGKPIPDTISGTGEKMDPSRLKLLQADRHFGWMELFWLGKNVYVFNTETHALAHFFTRDSAAPFVRITRGIYRDDKQVRFSASKNHLVSRYRGRGKSIAGKYSIFQPLFGVSPDKFTKTASLEQVPARQHGEIHEAGGIRYFHPRHRDQGATLYLLQTPGTAIRKESLKSIDHEEKYTYYLALQPAWKRYNPFFIFGLVMLAGIVSMILKKRKA